MIQNPREVNQLLDQIGQGSTYIIAEMSANHGGKIKNAFEIVRGAAEAGADCVKIQTYTADSLTIDCKQKGFMIEGGLWDGYKLYDLYVDAATPYEWTEPIMRECEKCGVDFLSTPFDMAGVDFLDKCGAEAYKIASFELVDIPLIEYVAAKGKPIVLSCGMASVEEIQEAVDACRRVRNDQIVLLKCCSEYPAPWDDMKLRNIPDMRDRFGVPVGLSDHSMGSLAATVAVSQGACVIEKHVKLEGVESLDSGFSMTMDEFAQMVKDIRVTEKMLQGPDYRLTDGERKQIVFRRSLYAVKDIAEGEEFTFKNVRSIRPGYGISPKYLGELVGMKSVRNIKFGEPIRMEDFIRE